MFFLCPFCRVTLGAYPQGMDSPSSILIGSNEYKALKDFFFVAKKRQPLAGSRMLETHRDPATEIVTGLLTFRNPKLLHLGAKQNKCGWSPSNA